MRHQEATIPRLAICAIAFALLVFISTSCFAASGDIYLKYYLPNSSYGATPDTQEGAVWEAGIYIEEQFKWFRPYGEISTRIDTWVSDRQAFHPASVEYTLGVAFDIADRVELKIEHMCWHHVDSETPIIRTGRVGGDYISSHKNQQYNRVELTYRFGGD